MPQNNGSYFHLAGKRVSYKVRLGSLDLFFLL